jgi:hypothetical protein
MKLLSDFETAAAISATSEDTDFPVENVLDLDPMLRWHAESYAVDQRVVLDFGTAKSINAVFLNQCNFPEAKIEGNATDSWGSPSFSLEVDLVQDDTENRKGWFDLTGFNLRFLSILVPAGQTLDNSEATPAIGNIICGVAVALPEINSFTPELIQDYSSFQTDDGGYSESEIGRKRHIITLVTDRNTLALMKAIPKQWSIGVLYADVDTVADSWLVYPPRNWQRPTGSVIDSMFTSLQFREKP